MGLRVYRVRATNTRDAVLQVEGVFDSYALDPNTDEHPCVSAILFEDESLELIESSMGEYAAKINSVEKLNNYFTERFGGDAYEKEKRQVLAAINQRKVSYNYWLLARKLMYMSFMESAEYPKSFNVLKDFFSFEEDTHYSGIDELDTWTAMVSDPAYKPMLVLCWVPY